MVFFLYILIPLAWITSLDASQKNFPFGDIGNGLASSDPMIHDLIKRVEVLEARDRSHSHAIIELEKNHRKEIDELKQELTNQKDEVATLRMKSAGQDRLISRLIQQMKPHVESSASDSEENGDAIRTTSFESKVNRIRRAENEVTVAFSAGLTHTFTHAGAHQNILFDQVETNIGNAYNPHHGVFTAPVSGLYVFYSSILTDFGREVWCEIVVNGKRKASVYARGTDGRHDQGSQTIIVRLQQGDDIAVRNVASDDAIYGSSGIYSTFSGFLLQQDYSQTGTIVG